MISASKFARVHHSFWNSYAPALENTVRTANLGAADRFSTPLVAKSNPARNFIINETAYHFIVRASQGHAPDWDEAFETARLRMRDLPGTPDNVAPLLKKERRDAVEIADKYLHFLKHYNLSVKDLLFDRTVAGCGIIDAGQIDAIGCGCAIEFKSGDRPFRATDFRQIVTYYCLIRAASSHEIAHIVVANPRRGVAVFLNVEQFIFDISGKDSSEFLLSFLSAVSGSGPSR